MGEVVELKSSQVIPLATSPSDTNTEAEAMQTITIIDGDPLKDITSSTSLQGYRHNPQEAWLPITESRNGNTYFAMFHLICSGLGWQALSLPIVFASLGWTWGIICLSLAFVWQLYTIFILVQLHEAIPRIRYSRYMQLAIASFGIEWYLVFTCIALLIVQLPNLNSIAWVSLIGATTAVLYSTLIWVLSITKDRPIGISYSQSDEMKSNMEKFSDVLNALGIIALAFKGHNVILEIQGTLPSSPKQTSYKSMCTGVTISHIVIAMCQYPLAIGGFWAYGNMVPYSGGQGLLTLFSQIHGPNSSKLMMTSIYRPVLVNCLCTFQVYAMVVFDNLEVRYTSKKNQPYPRWVRTFLRIFFGGLAFFLSVTFPFLGRLAPLVGGATLPLTFAYPCFMWIAMKKPLPNGLVWFINMGLGCFGIVLTILIVISAAWTLADNGLKANFYKP
uniref:Amino acid transporter transmembrane domain-containing protein n=1 Tax=Quercus lobata TaxID=97700 RepID=A0A7N2N2X8_QUELO